MAIEQDNVKIEDLIDFVKISVKNPDIENREYYYIMQKPVTPLLFETALAEIIGMMTRSAHRRVTTAFAKFQLAGDL